MLINSSKHINDDFFIINNNIKFNSPLLDDLTKAIMISASRQDYNFALMSALMTINLFVTREVITPTSSSMIMYVILLANSGYGKDRFLKAPANILMATGQDNINIRMSISSVPALEKSFSLSKILYHQLDEIGGLIHRLTKAKFSNIELNLDSYLKRAWSIEANDMEFTTETKDRNSELLEYPILNIYGCSTEKSLYSSLSKIALHDGFYNRFLIVEASKVKKNRDRVPLFLCQSIIEGLAKFNTLSEYSTRKHEILIPAFKVPWDSDEVKQRFYNFENEIENILDESEDIHSLFVRLPEMAIRIATLIAVSRDYQYARVKMDDLEYAINFVKLSGNTSLKKVKTLISDNAYEALRTRVLGLIESNGIQGISGRNICRKLSINKQLRDRIISDLIDFDAIIENKYIKIGKDNKSKKMVLFFSNSELVRNKLNETSEETIWDLNKNYA